MWFVIVGGGMALLGYISRLIQDRRKKDKAKQEGDK